MHGQPPLVLDLCCGKGGQARGAWRAGCSVIGMDIYDMPNFPTHLPGVTFERKDVNDLTAAEIKATGADLVIAGPACQPYSGLPVLSGAGSTVPRLINSLHQVLCESGLPFYIENVVGSKQHMEATGGHIIKMCGCQFGLRVFRARYLCSNMPLSQELNCDKTSTHRGLCLGANSAMKPWSKGKRHYPGAVRAM